ncbi:MAG: hypothetical protein R2867_07670 [Caldilineaceae bacterium]
MLTGESQTWRRLPGDEAPRLAHHPLQDRRRQSTTHPLRRAQLGRQASALLHENLNPD